MFRVAVDMNLADQPEDFGRAARAGVRRREAQSTFSYRGTAFFVRLNRDNPRLRLQCGATWVTEDFDNPWPAVFADNNLQVRHVAVWPHEAPRPLPKSGWYSGRGDSQVLVDPNFRTPIHGSGSDYRQVVELYRQVVGGSLQPSRPLL